jgi:hypothetical protein
LKAVEQKGWSQPQPESAYVTSGFWLFGIYKSTISSI